jgi:hypothetical protein
MSNIFNDLNKLVNTVQKVDKLLTEKPKRTRTKSLLLTEKELWFIYSQLKRVMDFEEDPTEEKLMNCNIQDKIIKKIHKRN